jgi:hypothetical protein
MMWMLSFVPDAVLFYIVNAILVIGAIGTFLTFFILHRIVRWLPAIAPYHLILQIISMVFLVAGLYLRGGYGVEMEWRERVAEMEKKVAAAEAKSKEANTVVETKIVEKVKVIKEQGQKQIEYIDRVVKGDTTEIIKDMSENERKAFLAKQKELEDAIKNCPVPKIVVEELNKAAKSK